MYSKRELLNWLWELGDGKNSPPTQKNVTEHSEAPSAGTYHERFPDWATAVREAGFSEKAALKVDTRSEKQIQEYTDQELLRNLHEMKEKLGRTPTRSDLNENDDGPGGTAYRRHFGTWTTALEKAGMEPNRELSGQRKYSNEELLEHIRSVRDDLGRPPTERDINNVDGPSVYTYRDRFGYWSTAKSMALEDCDGSAV